MARGIKRVSAAKVVLWGKVIGAIAWDGPKEFASFEYEPSFLSNGYDISPLTLPRRVGIFSFPTLNKNTFYGLPGLLADSIPDKFGNALIDTWLARQGRSKNDFSPVERLCYIASRGMGALEFEPPIRPLEKKAVPIEIAQMIQLVQNVIDNRTDLLVNLGDKEHALETIIRIGTSAGGARAKALIAWNRATDDLRSGQVTPPRGFEPWILKFDGVTDKTLGITQDFGRIEYAYNQMAVEAGIEMTQCHLFEENGRAHFMTRRFDREPNGDKIHMQTLCALGHYDFNEPGAYGYEQAFSVIQQLGLGYDTLEEMYRRMVFNIVARNQDDHTKNISFLMGRDAQWRLSPAYDVMWAHNPSGTWTNQHQMSVNGKRDGFSRADLLEPSQQFGIKNASVILEGVIESVRKWSKVAKDNGVSTSMIDSIGRTHRLVWK